MTVATTVANRPRLLDATQPCPIDDPWCRCRVALWVEFATTDNHGDLVRYTPDLYGNWWISMGQVTVDGATSTCQDEYGKNLFTIKDDETPGKCQPNAEGFCDCRPGKYIPLRYNQGDICDRCWLTYGIAVGIGKGGCDHK